MSNTKFKFLMLVEDDDDPAGVSAEYLLITDYPEAADAMRATLEAQQRLLHEFHFATPVPANYRSPAMENEKRSPLLMTREEWENSPPSVAGIIATRDVPTLKDAAVPVSSVSVVPLPPLPDSKIRLLKMDEGIYPVRANEQETREARRDIGIPPAMQIAKAGMIFESSARLSAALGFSFNAVSQAISLARAKGQKTATLKGVEFCYDREQPSKTD